MTNQTDLRVIELTEIVEGETEPLYDHTIQYRNDGGQWTSLPVVRVFDRDTYEMMQNGDDSKRKEQADRIEELKAKLAKAVDALDEAVYLLDPDDEDIAKETGLHRIVTTLAELKGETDA